MDFLSVNKRMLQDKSPILDLAEKIVLFVAPFIIAVWKLVDAYFAYQSKKDKEFVKELVSELITGALQGITKDISELKDDRKKDYEHFNQTVVNIYKEIKNSHKD